VPRLGENADILRALGRFLDDQGATTFDIVNHDAFLAVSWDRAEPGPQQRAYQEHQLRDLRAEARSLRRDAEAPVGSLVELLRTVGQELDSETVELTSITRDATAFRVSGVLNGRLFQAHYRTKDLVALAAARRAGRGQALDRDLGSGGRETPDSFLGVQVGAAVYGEDGERFGKVTEIRDRYFRVTRPGLRGDFWLPAESVASIGPEGAVTLAPVET
jgi:hypothetical protein